MIDATTPHEFPADIRLPAPAVDCRLVGERPGSRTWKATLADDRTVAVKHTTGSGQPTGRFAAREAAVLTYLAPHHLVASGTTTTGSWLAVTWDDAPTIAHHWRHLPAHRQTATWAAHQAAAALAQAHDAGWRHGDLQATHLLCPAGRPTRLLDWTFAHGPAHLTPRLPPVTYRGGYAHLVAPEIAAELLDTPATHSVSLTEAADVYSLGAVLLSLWSRQWPCDYGSTDPRTLTAPQIYTAITNARTRRPPPGDWPDMAKIITAMMHREPHRRLSAHDAAALLHRPIDKRGPGTHR